MRSFENNNQYGLTDLTPALRETPIMRTLLGDMGLFVDHPVTQRNITIELQKDEVAIVGDVVRGAQNIKNNDTVRQLKSYIIPHFNLVDSITAASIEGVLGYNGSVADTVAAAKIRKLEAINRHWTATQELAKFKAITTGKAYIPNLTVPEVDYYADLGKTRKVVNFAFADVNVKRTTKIEEVIAYVQDNTLTGGLIGAVKMLCSPEFFGALIADAQVSFAFSQYQSQQEPLRNRLGGDTTVNRTFVYAGIEFIEVRGGYAGQLFIPAGEAYAFPQGIPGMFEMYYAPAVKFSSINALAQTSYVFEYTHPHDEEIQLVTESNFLPFIRRPEAIVRCTSA